MNIYSIISILSFQKSFIYDIVKIIIIILSFHCLAQIYHLAIYDPEKKKKMSTKLLSAPVKPQLICSFQNQLSCI